MNGVIDLSTCPVTYPRDSAHEAHHVSPTQVVFSPYPLSLEDGLSRVSKS